MPPPNTEDPISVSDTRSLGVTRPCPSSGSAASDEDDQPRIKANTVATLWRGSAKWCVFPVRIVVKFTQLPELDQLYIYKTSKRIGVICVEPDGNGKSLIGDVR